MKPSSLLPLSLLSLLSLGAQAELRSFSPDDLHKLQAVSEPVFSADGKQLAYSVTRHNLDSDAQVSDLWTVDYATGQKKQLTHTPFDSEWAPAYSPDGKWLAFLADNSDDGSAQIFVMPANKSGKRSKARQVTHISTGVSDFVWSPDSKQFAFIAEQPAAPVQKDSRGEDKPQPPLVIDRFQFMEDYRDYLTSNFQRLWTVQLDGKQLTQLTFNDTDAWLPSWSPDGKHIAYVTRTGPEPDRHLNYDVYTIAPVAGSQPEKISQFAGSDVDPYWESRPSWSPDSTQLAWLQSGEAKWIYYAPWQIVVADLANRTERKLAHIDRSFYKPRFSADGKSVFAQLEQNLNTYLVRIDLDDQEIHYLNKGRRFGYGYAVNARNQAVETVSTEARPFYLEAVQATPRTLADHNEWLNQVQLAGYEELQFNSGDQTIEGFLVKPIGYQAGKTYPTIVRVHGGPVYQFSNEFMEDWQVYAARGYAVLAVNPRGSSGRGFDFSRAIYQAWGGVDVQDVLAGVDHVVARGVADPERLGVGGWSYGGILTDFLIANTTRFKAAISGAGVGNVLGSYGHDQYTREYELELGTPWDNFDNYVRNSQPFLQANKIKTPTLFQCAEKDFNVPCLGAEQMYQALKSLRVSTQLIIYPGEHHGISVPSYLQDRMQRNLAWYNRYLKP